MKKLTFFILSLLFFFCQTDSLIAQLGCPLPAPQNVHITTVTPTSLFVAWNSVPGAVSYKISVYDQTDMVALPDVFSTSPSVELADLSTATHEYQIGVSASACTTGPYGAPATTNYKPGIIIIIDVIVQVDAPNFSIPLMSPSTNPEGVILPSNSNPPGKNIRTQHVKIVYDGFGLDTPIVEFLVWSDCFDQIRFHEIRTKNTRKTASGNSIAYKLLNNTNFFVLANGETSATPTIQYSNTSACRVTRNEWIIKNTIPTCGTEYKQEGYRQGQGGLDNRLGTNYDHDVQFSRTPHLPLTDHAPESANPRVTPNPFSDYIQLQYEVKSFQPVEIELVNSMGVQVEQLLPMAWMDAGSYQTTLPVNPNLPSGLYFLLFRTDTERRVIPVIKE